MSVRSSRSNTTTKAMIRVWLTTSDQTNLLTRQPDITWNRNGKTSGLTITVDEQQSYQQMVGFGASFTDSSAWLVQKKLAVKKRTDLMKKLFHPRAWDRPELLTPTAGCIRLYEVWQLLLR